LSRFFKQAADVINLADIGAIAHNFGSRAGCDFRGGLFGRGTITGAYDYATPFSGQLFRASSPQPPARGSHQCDFSSNSKIHDNTFLDIEDKHKINRVQ
jgi:hypothetical protein